jgi:type I restriction enzyme, S subunit
MSSELRRLWEQAGGKLPGEWKIVSLESLLRDSKSIAVGVMYPGPDTHGGIPLIKVGDIKDGTVAVKPSYCISDKINEEHKRTQLTGDELLITLVGNPGECVVVTHSMSGWNPARAIATIRLKEPNLRIYLKTVLESIASKHLIDAVLNTTVQKTLNLKDIRKLPIPFPPQYVIQDISEIANALTNRIALLRETNATLEAIAQALFKSWFVDFDPVRAKREGREPEGMDSDTAVLFPDSFEESELGLVPKGWVVKSLGKKFVPTKGRNITKLTVTTGEVPVVAGGLSPAYYHNECNVDGPVTTISASGANAGYVKLYHENIWASDCSYVSKRHTNHVYSMYLFLKSRQSEITYMQQGAAQPHVYPKDLMRLLIADAPVALWDNFESLVSPFFEQIRVSLVEASCLSDLRDTLLPRLISGQLRLPEAQALTEEATE